MASAVEREVKLGFDGRRVQCSVIGAQVGGWIHLDLIVRSADGEMPVSVERTIASADERIEIPRSSDVTSVSLVGLRFVEPGNLP